MIEDTANQSASVVAADAPAPAQTGSALPQDEVARLTDQIVSALKTVYDPEIPADIYELGPDLQDRHRRRSHGDGRHDLDDAQLPVRCRNCRSWPRTRSPASRASGRSTVNIVWDPPWEPSRMSDEARVVLNMW